MNSKEIVKTIMNEKEISNSALASRLNITPAALWQRLNYKQSKDLSVSVLTGILRQLDHKLVIMPRSSRVSPESYEVE